MNTPFILQSQGETLIQNIQVFLINIRLLFNNELIHTLEILPLIDKVSCQRPVRAPENPISISSLRNDFISLTPFFEIKKRATNDTAKCYFHRFPRVGQGGLIFHLSNLWSVLYL